MDDTPQSESFASTDELARLYLRGRDVPCPGCGYNRRDGVAAACPECGRILTISTGSSAGHRTLHLGISGLSAVGISLGLVGVVFLSFAVYEFAAGASMIGMMPWPVYLSYGAQLFSVVAMTLAIVLLVRARTVRSGHGSAESLRRPIVALTIVMCIAVTTPLVVQVLFWLMY